DLDEALSIATRCGCRLHETDAHLGHARLCLAQGEPAAAGPHLASARELIEQTGYHRRDEELAALEAEARTMATPAPLPMPTLTPPAPPPPPAPNLAKPMPTASSAPQPVDLGIIVALQEEFRELLDLARGYTPHKNDVLTAYSFERGSYRIAAA